MSLEYRSALCQPFKTAIGSWPMKSLSFKSLFSFMRKSERHMYYVLRHIFHRFVVGNATNESLGRSVGQCVGLSVTLYFQYSNGLLCPGPT